MEQCMSYPTVIFKPYWPRVVTNDPSILPINKLISDYLSHIYGCNQYTFRAKTSDLECFYQWCLFGWSNPVLGDITPGLLDQYRDYCINEKKLAPTSVGRRCATLKVFFSWISERFGVPDLARTLREPKVRLGKPKSMTLEDQRKLRRHLDEHRLDSYKAARLYAFVETAFETGFRLNELSQLRECQIAPDLSSFKGVWTKGSKVANHPISDHLRDVLEWYLPRRQRYLSERFHKDFKVVETEFSTFPLFPRSRDSDQHNPASWTLRPKNVWLWLRSACQECGIARISAHVIRHTFATDLLESTHDIRLVAQALNHSDPKITMRYTERSEERMRDELNRMNAMRLSR
jgi:integrase/recombinase XerD